MKGLTRRTVRNAHKYKCHIHASESFVGCTTIMKAQAAGYALTQWKARQPLLAALDEIDKVPGMLASLGGRDGTVDYFMKAGSADTSKRDLGTQAHQLVEHDVKGELDGNGDLLAPCARDHEDCRGVTPATAGHLAGFRRWAVDSGAIITASEFMVISESERYGATGDLAFVLKSDLVLSDLKTGGAYVETGLQLAAVRWADHAGVEGDDTVYAIPQATKFGVLLLTENGTELVPYDVRPDREFKAFLACRDLYEWDKVGSKALIAS